MIGSKLSKQEYKERRRLYNEAVARGENPGAAVATTTPQICVKVYKTAGQYKRGVQEMARYGWVVQAQSSATPSSIGWGSRTGWTKTMVTFTRGGVPA